MDIAIIGAGAMGCLYACLLHSHHRVTLYDVSEPTVTAVSRAGVTVREHDGTAHTAPVGAALSGQNAAPKDLVILFVKDTASRAALQGNRGLIGPRTLLLSLQNGLGNDEILSDFAAPDRILLGTTKHNAVTTAPGELFHSGAGLTRIGSPAGCAASADTVVRAFSECGIDTERCDNVKYLLWEKLFVNMTVNPLTALLGCHIAAVADDPALRELTAALIDEAVTVAGRDGAVFDPAAVTDSVLHTVHTLADGKASMCQDLEHGRRTEIDFINGAVVRLGKKYGVETPYHAAIVSLIHAKERLVCPAR